MTSETPRTDAAKTGARIDDHSSEMFVPIATAKQLEREAAHYKALANEMRELVNTISFMLDHPARQKKQDWQRRYNEGPRAGGEKGET